MVQFPSGHVIGIDNASQYLEEKAKIIWSFAGGYDVGGQHDRQTMARIKCLCRQYCVPTIVGRIGRFAARIVSVVVRHNEQLRIKFNVLGGRMAKIPQSEVSQHLNVVGFDEFAVFCLESPIGRIPIEVPYGQAINTYPSSLIKLHRPAVLIELQVQKDQSSDSRDRTKYGDSIESSGRSQRVRIMYFLVGLVLLVLGIRVNLYGDIGRNLKYDFAWWMGHGMASIGGTATLLSLVASHYLPHPRRYMKHEYHEGPDAAARFEDTMKKLFQVPKSSVKPRAITKRTPKKTSKGNVSACLALADT